MTSKKGKKTISEPERKKTGTQKKEVNRERKDRGLREDESHVL